MPIALNCDLGEISATWNSGRDQLILPYLKYANISCGAHAGDESLILKTLKTTRDSNVIIGAHPGYPDKANFGRKSMLMTSAEFTFSISSQIKFLMEMAKAEHTEVTYIKPHGALYNDMIKNVALARQFAELVLSISPNLSIMGMPYGALKEACLQLSIAYISEAFIDRRYTSEGTLASRNQPNGVIDNIPDAISQLKSMIENGTVQSIDHQKVTIKADTYCIHGDSPMALDLIYAINEQGYLIN